MKLNWKKYLAGLSLACVLGVSGSPLLAADYPPALNYDHFIEAIQVGDTDGKLYFSRKLLSIKTFVPGRHVQVRTDVVDSQGNILSTQERMHTYQNGRALSEIKSSVFECPNRPENKCLMGKDIVELKPGLHWMVYSENGKVFSAEWFELRSFPLGEGRFAKGEKFYTVLPQDNMARLFFSDAGTGQLTAEFGISAGAEVGDKSAVTKKMSVALKHNGQPFGKGLGNVPQPVNIYASTSLISSPLLKIQGNTGIKPQDLKDGKYELDLNLDGKSVRKFNFEVKGGKIVYQGRQQENTQPPERLIVAEKSYWLWNTYAKEAAHKLPNLNLASETSAPAAAAPANNTPAASQPASNPSQNTDAVGDALKKLPKLPF